MREELVWDHLHTDELLVGQLQRSLPNGVQSRWIDADDASDVGAAVRCGGAVVVADEYIEEGAADSDGLNGLLAGSQWQL